MLGEGTWTQLKNWATRSFGAPTFIEFWRYWNPVYGYFLFYWAYKPLRAVLPRPVAAWLTFLVSGFVPHDMIGWTLGRRVQAPVMTIMFALLGGVAVAADIAHMDLSRAPFVVRLAANVSYLGGCFVITRAFLP